MIVHGVVRSHDPDERDEAILVCEFCGQRDLYVFGWVEPYEAAEEYARRAKCLRCGRISGEGEATA